MSQHECAREQDVVDAVLSGAWPERVDADLTAHASDCEHLPGGGCRGELCCREDTITPGVTTCSVPAAGQVWWRAAVRARLEAAQAARSR